MTDSYNNKKIILFDGVCNLCNSSVINIIKMDKKNTFLFTSLQSKSGKEIIKYLNIDVLKIDSVILYEPNIRYDIKSTAALKIMNDFGGLWKMVNIFFMIPPFIRDVIYDFIAKNRYKWFGKKNACMIPSPELKKKFLD